MVSLADTLLSTEASQSVRHKQLISTYRHLLLRSLASISQSGDRTQRASLTGEKNESDRIYINPEYRGMMGKHRDLSTPSDHVTY